MNRSLSLGLIGTCSVFLSGSYLYSNIVNNHSPARYIMNALSAVLDFVYLILFVYQLTPTSTKLMGWEMQKSEFIYTIVFSALLFFAALYWLFSGIYRKTRHHETVDALLIATRLVALTLLSVMAFTREESSTSLYQPFAVIGSALILLHLQD